MFSYQIFIMILLCFLLLNKASFLGAFIILMAFCVYGMLVIPMQDTHYYSCAALLVFAVGYILHGRYNLAAICSYSLVIANVGGYWLYENYYEPVLYDNICAIILLIQLSSLLPKGLLNGLRRNNQHTMAKFTFFNGS